MKDFSKYNKGPLAWFANNHVAANLLMLLIVTGGLLNLLTSKTELFPDISVEMITITVPYLGASPAEVEEGVCVRVEEAVAGIEGIKRLRSAASEGAGTVIAELEEGADNRKVLDDIKAAVDRIITFPAETEEPIIREASKRGILSVKLFPYFVYAHRLRL